LNNGDTENVDIKVLLGKDEVGFQFPKYNIYVHYLRFRDRDVSVFERSHCKML
jgi:hypothetical protein